jgi:ankyrin repeat protein
MAQIELLSWCREANLGKVRALLASSPHLIPLLFNGRSALIEACLYRRLSIVREIIAQSEVNLRSEEPLLPTTHRSTALHFALMGDMLPSLAIVQLLIDSGANTVARNANGASAAQLAARQLRYCENQPNPRATDIQTCREVCALLGGLAHMDLLAPLNVASVLADVERYSHGTDLRGRTILHWAARAQRYDLFARCVELLGEHARSIAAYEVATVMRQRENRGAHEAVLRASANAGAAQVTIGFATGVQFVWSSSSDDEESSDADEESSEKKEDSEEKEASSSSSPAAGAAIMRWKFVKNPRDLRTHEVHERPAESSEVVRLLAVNDVFDVLEDVNDRWVRVADGFVPKRDAEGVRAIYPMATLSDADAELVTRCRLALLRAVDDEGRSALDLYMDSVTWASAFDETRARLEIIGPLRALMASGAVSWSTEVARAHGGANIFGHLLAQGRQQDHVGIRFALATLVDDFPLDASVASAPCTADLCRPLFALLGSAEYFAERYGDWLLEMLLAAGADVRQRDQQLRSVAQCAIDTGLIARAVRLVAELGCPTLSGDTQNNSIWHSAARQRAISADDAALLCSAVLASAPEQHAELMHAPNSEGRSPLDAALRTRNASVFSWMLQHGGHVVNCADVLDAFANTNAFAGAPGSDACIDAAVAGAGAEHRECVEQQFAFAQQRAALVDSSHYADVRFRVRCGTIVRGHKILLAMASEHFAAMFRHAEMREATLDVIDIASSRAAFLTFLHCAYIGSVPIERCFDDARPDYNCEFDDDDDGDVNNEEGEEGETLRFETCGAEGLALMQRAETTASNLTAEDEYDGRFAHPDVDALALKRGQVLEACNPMRGGVALARIDDIDGQMLRIGFIDDADYCSFWCAYDHSCLAAPGFAHRAGLPIKQPSACNDEAIDDDARSFSWTRYFVHHADRCPVPPTLFPPSRAIDMPDCVTFSLPDTFRVLQYVHQVHPRSKLPLPEAYRLTDSVEASSSSSNGGGGGDDGQSGGAIAASSSPSPNVDGGESSGPARWLLKINDKVTIKVPNFVDYWQECVELADMWALDAFRKELCAVLVDALLDGKSMNVREVFRLLQLCVHTDHIFDAADGSDWKEAIARYIVTPQFAQMLEMNNDAVDLDIESLAALLRTEAIGRASRLATTSASLGDAASSSPSFSSSIAAASANMRARHRIPGMVRLNQ